MKRKLSLCLIAALAVLGAEREARACSVALSCGFPLPASAARVPANVPALGVGNHGGNVPFLALVDDQGAPVAAAREVADGATFLRLTRPLKEGASYTFTVGCGLDGGLAAPDGGASPEARKVTAGAPAPMPTSLGRLKLLDARDDAFSTAGQADCQGLRRAKVAHLRWTPDGALAPFGQVLLVTKNGAPDFYVGNTGAGNDSLKVELGSGTSPVDFEVKLACLAVVQRATLVGGVLGAARLPDLEVEVPACVPSPGEAAAAPETGGCALAVVGSAAPRWPPGLLVVALAGLIARFARGTRGPTRHHPK